jgi:hypothetical protein
MAFSTDPLPQDLESSIQDRGATVRPEFRYDPEVSSDLALPSPG